MHTCHNGPWAAGGHGVGWPSLTWRLCEGPRSFLGGAATRECNGTERPPRLRGSHRARMVWRPKFRDVFVKFGRDLDREAPIKSRIISHDNSTGRIRPSPPKFAELFSIQSTAQNPEKKSRNSGLGQAACEQSAASSS